MQPQYRGGALPPPPLPPFLCLLWERGGRGAIWAGVTVGRGRELSPIPTNMEEKTEKGGEGSASRGDTPIHLCSLARAGGAPAPAAKSSWPPPRPPLLAAY